MQRAKSRRRPVGKSPRSCKNRWDVGTEDEALGACREMQGFYSFCSKVVLRRRGPGILGFSEEGSKSIMTR